MLETQTRSIGTIIGFLFPGKLVFVSKKRLIIGDYVIARDDIDGKPLTVLARINDLVFSDLESATRAFATPQSVVYRIAEARTDPFDMYMVAQCEVLGVPTDDNLLAPLRTTVRPGL